MTLLQAAAKSAAGGGVRTLRGCASGCARVVSSGRESSGHLGPGAPLSRVGQSPCRKADGRGRRGRHRSRRF